MKKVESTYWQTSVSHQEADTILIRGYPIEQIIGNLSFTATLFLVLKGRLPSGEEQRMLDAALCAIIDYAAGPAPVVARVVVSANPHLGAAMAAGILAQGAHAVSPQEAGSLLEQLAHRVEEGGDMQEIAAETVASALERRVRIPGLGHPSAMQQDPRAQRLRDCALSLGFWGIRCRLIEAICAAYGAATGRSLVINVDGMLGAVLGDMGFDRHEMSAVAALSMLPGIIANAVEEIASGPRIRIIKEMRYTGPERRTLEVTS